MSDDVRGALERLGIAGAEAARIQRLCDGFVGDNRWHGRTPSWFITQQHRIIKRETGLREPFAELRGKCNEVGAAAAGELGNRLRGLDDEARFRETALWAIAGNHLDFRTVGAGYAFSPAEILDMLREKAAQGLAVDDIDEIRGLAARKKNIVYIPDNVGEVAFDALLVAELRRMGCRVTVPYRGGPITSDATLGDFRAVGLDRAADEVIEAGPDTLGISIEEMSAPLKDALGSAGMIVTKGQANLYAMDELRRSLACPVACLLTTKCGAASEVLGARGKVNAAALIRR
jgi:uncharacterized protein with ATP-grasp and redox domains